MMDAPSCGMGVVPNQARSTIRVGADPSPSHDPELLAKQARRGREFSEGRRKPSLADEPSSISPRWRLSQRSGASGSAILTARGGRHEIQSPPSHTIPSLTRSATQLRAGKHDLIRTSTTAPRTLLSQPTVVAHTKRTRLTQMLPSRLSARPGWLLSSGRIQPNLLARAHRIDAPPRCGPVPGRNLTSNS